MKTTLKKGFTLIELMIVIAIIAIIAAIAIPNLMQSRIQANETNALAALKAYGTAQATFIKGGYSLRAGVNGTLAGASSSPYSTTVKQYAYPFTDLHFTSRTEQGDGASEPVALITEQFANAVDGLNAWQGYMFTEYSMDKPNPNSFDLVTGPAEYGQTGNNLFRTDTSGAVWQVDAGSTGTGELDVDNFTKDKTGDLTWINA